MEPKFYTSNGQLHELEMNGVRQGRTRRSLTTLRNIRERSGLKTKRQFFTSRLAEVGTCAMFRLLFSKPRLSAFVSHFFHGRTIPRLCVPRPLQLALYVASKTVGLSDLNVTTPRRTSSKRESLFRRKNHHSTALAAGFGSRFLLSRSITASRLKEAERDGEVDLGWSH